MKRIKNLVIGGIQSKVFNLILYTVVLLTAAFTVMFLVHSNMLTNLTRESSAKQQAAIGQITDRVMDQVVTQSLSRSNRTEARFANEMFESVRDRVTFLGDLTANLLAHPEDYTPRPYAGPDLADDGKWTAKVIYADGVDPSDPAVAEKVGLLSNLSDTMISLCPAFGAATIYIALP